ncbi:MAG: PD-(D/E)XK nuclease family protein [Halieaceae bacterium]|nr:PD-(D/E)XK nuclease family protein [Halieaceae bacterium]
MTEIPNLYSFATKELAQDATLAYILAWSQPKYRKSHPRLNGLGTEMLRALLATKLDESSIPDIRDLEIKTQYHRIDVLVLINDENEDGLVLLIEDKVGTNEHSNQIEHYIKVAEEHYPNRKIVPVYMKTGNASQCHLPSAEKCGRFLRRDLLGVLVRFQDTGDTIADNFRTHLQDWERETNNYRNVCWSEWGEKWVRFEGFYTELEKQMEEACEWSSWGWEFVNNPSGGFLGFFFAETPIEWGPDKVIMYLQIENATRLTVRLGDRDGPGIRAPLMYKVLGLLEDNALRSGDVRIKKAGRFRGGKSGAVAQITFGTENGYLALKDGCIVDLEATMQRLRRARKFVAEVGSHTGR